MKLNKKIFVILVSLLFTFLCGCTQNTQFDRGFGSEIWACEGEWREVECPQRKAVNIQWDIDPEDDDGVELPNEITIPNDIEDEEAISDYISEVTGFCHKGFELEEQL